MPAGVIGIAMNNGYEGTISVTADSIVQARLAKVAEGDPNGYIPFGAAVSLGADNTYSRMTGKINSSTHQLADGKFAGIAVREVIQANTFDPQSNTGYNDKVPCDALVRGQCTIKVLGGTVAAGGAVYPVYGGTTEGVDLPFIGFAGASYTDASNTVSSTAIPNMEFTTGNVDANDIAEVTIKTRNIG